MWNMKQYVFCPLNRWKCFLLQYITDCSDPTAAAGGSTVPTDLTLSSGKQTHKAEEDQTSTVQH